jgi:acetyl-coenzyme A carboxylase carboxyl transferase subunit alpha 
MERQQSGGQSSAGVETYGSDLLELGLIDQILPEPLGAAHADPVQATETLKQALLDNLARLRELDGATLMRQRYDKFRRMGVFAGG